MPKTLLQKMYYKPEYAVLLLHVPKNLEKDLFITDSADTKIQGGYQFILAFYSKKEDIEKEISQLVKALQVNGLLWIAYPKAKALQTDLNRDILHKTMQNYQLEGVSLVSLDDTWSAMRFKRK